MEFCPVCKSELQKTSENCHVCSTHLTKQTETEWLCIGLIEDKISADYAEETLKSYKIPVVVFSRSGFFGSAGLNLSPFHGTTSGLFEVSVPINFKEEAEEILRMILGDRFQVKDC